MKKLSLIFLFVFLLIFIGCSEDNTSPSRSKEENEFLSKSHPDLNVAVRNNVPEYMDKPTIGILDKGRTETFANVVYINSEKSVYYQFEYDGEVWARNDYEHVRYHVDKPVGKITANSVPLVKVYQEENYIGSSQSKLVLEDIETLLQDGYYTSDSWGNWATDEYEVVKSCHFVKPPLISIGNLDYNISWDGSCYFYFRYDSVANNQAVYQDSVPSTKNNTQYAVETNVTVYVDLTAPLPPAPSLSSPSSGSTTTKNVTFSWGDVTGYAVDKYYISIFDIVNQTYVVSNQPVNGTSYSSSIFSYSKSYSWQVRSHNLTGPGSWSSSRTFTVQDPPTPSITVSSIGNHQYSASASGGSGTYSSYEWWYRNDGDPLSRAPQVGVWIKNSSWDDNTTVTFDPSYDNFSLKCKVTDSNNYTAEDIYSERSLR